MKTYLRRNLGNINVGKDDSRVIAAQLKGDPLHRFTSRLGNPLARGRAAGEADLVDTGVYCQPWAKALVTTQQLQNTRREDLCPQLCDLDQGIGGEWRRLHDDRVASQHTRAYLAYAYEQRPVPRDNGTPDTDGPVSDNSSALGRILDRLVEDAQVSSPAEVGNAVLDLHVRRGDGLAAFRDQEVADLHLVRLYGVGEQVEVGGALVPGLLAPCREGGAGGRYGLVDLRLAREGDIGQGLLRAGVLPVAGSLGGGEFAIYDICESLWYEFSNQLLVLVCKRGQRHTPCPRKGSK